MARTESPETLETIEGLVQALKDVWTVRYVTAVGMILMLYDHALTFSDEVGLVWKAAPSFSKKLFLLNRYVALLVQACIAIAVNHFGVDSLSDVMCKSTTTAACSLGLISTACANILVLLRVNVLWDHNYRALISLGLVFCVCFFTSLSFTVVIIKKAFHSFQYIPLLRSCGAVLDAPKFLVVWISSMLFEVLMLISVIINGLYRPRSQDTPLRRVLYRDGIFFFASLSTMQLASLILLANNQRSFDALGVFFVWAMTTLILNRSLFSMQKASLRQRTLTGPIKLSDLDPGDSADNPDIRHERSRRRPSGTGSSNTIFPGPESADPSYVRRVHTTHGGTNPVPGRPGMQILCVGEQCIALDCNLSRAGHLSRFDSRPSLSRHRRVPSSGDPILHEPEETVYTEEAKSTSDSTFSGGKHGHSRRGEGSVTPSERSSAERYWTELSDHPYCNS